MAPLVGQGYDLIGTRYKPGQTQAEFYNTQNQVAFENPQMLSDFVRAQYGNTSVNPNNVFDVLSQGFTPRAQALDQITNQLNQQQNQTFQEQQQPSQRNSSTIQQNIDTENKNLTNALAEFNTLKAKMTSMQAPNYQQEYNALRTQAGIPGIENDFANNQKSIRELPYVNRMNSGNAAVMTEGQLAADTQQKGIPLEIQQANLLDRLKLAGDFVNNSLKFKEMDANAARESIGHAIDLVLQSVNLSRQQISDYQNQQDRIEARASEFTKANNITGRFYKLPGSDLVFDSQTLEALPFEEYKRRGGIGVQGQDGAYADVQEIQPQTVQEERAIVADMAAKYIDAGITLNDTLAVAQSKVQNSRIYQDAVRPPARSGGSGGGSGGSGASSNSGDIDQYADAVFNGRVNLSGVPIKIRSQVDQKVQDLKANAADKYDTEFEARVDYDREIRELETAVKNGQTPSLKTSEIIQTLANDYGKYISEQEIAATIRNLLG